MTQSKWTGELDLTVFHNGKRSVARYIFFESTESHSSCLS